MPPIEDPRFTEGRWERSLQADRAAADRAGRMDYVKPAVMFLVGGAGVMATILMTGRDDPNATPLVVDALAYPIVLTIQLVFGVGGLWIAATLWLGGAGPLGLAILRLAGIYALTDLIGLGLAPMLFVGWLIKVSLYVVMLAWLFEFDIKESIMVAIITFLLKFIAALAVGYVIAGLR